MVMCKCGRATLMKTSKTSKNPERRFYTCPQMVKIKCKLFVWIDPPVNSPPSPKLGLHNPPNHSSSIENRFEELKHEIRRKDATLLMSWCILVGLLVLILVVVLISLLLKPF
ncbi:putative transcription factor GRF family [Helianthus anomalus]